MGIGITGTRFQLSEYQVTNITEYLQDIMMNARIMRVIPFLHHGDCVGADVTVADIAKSLGFNVVCHPPIKNELRANHNSEVIKPPLSYFARNRNIVDSVSILMVVPFQMEHQASGGTWYTHDYAVKRNVPTIIFWPGVNKGN